MIADLVKFVIVQNDENIDCKQKPHLGSNTNHTIISRELFLRFH